MSEQRFSTDFFAREHEIDQAAHAVKKAIDSAREMFRMTQFEIERTSYKNNGLSTIDVHRLTTVNEGLALLHMYRDQINDLRAQLRNAISSAGTTIRETERKLVALDSQERKEQASTQAV